MSEFEAWGDVVNEIVTGYADASMTPVSYIRDGEWHKAVMRMRMPVNAKELYVMARMLTPNTEGED